jgi:hypothetical protein
VVLEGITEKGITTYKSTQIYAHADDTAVIARNITALKKYYWHWELKAEMWNYESMKRKQSI